MRHTGNQFSQFSQSSQNFAREQQMRANRMEEEPPQTNVKARMMATGGSLQDDAISPPSNGQQRAS